MSAPLPLRSRGFWPMFCVQGLGALNDNLFKNVVVLAIAFAPGGDPLAANRLVIAAGALFILPFALFSLPGGWLADRMDKARLVQVLKFLECLLMGAGAFALARSHVPGMLVVTFLMGAQSAIFGPCKYAILPQHLPLSVLPRVNGLFQLSTFVAILLGTLVAGLVAAMGAGRAGLAGLLVLAVSGVGLAAALCIPAAPPAQAPAQQPGAPPRGVLRGTLKREALMPVILAIAWLWFAAITVMGLVPGLVRDRIGGGELGVTALLMALTVGVAAGCLFVTAADRVDRVGLACVRGGGFGIVAGLALLAGAIVLPTGWRLGGTFAASMVVGAAAGIYVVPLITRLQRGAGLSVRARVLALSNLVNALAMMLASGLSLLLVATLDYAPLFLALCVPGGVVALVLLPRLVLTGPPSDALRGAPV